MTASETVPSTVIAQLSRPHDATETVRRSLIACWTAVVNAGGAVVPMGCPLPPVTQASLRPAVGRIARELSPDHSRLLVARVDGTLAGWLLLRREAHPLAAHCGVLNHVQTHVHFRGRGIGAAMMRHAQGVARDEMGLERLQLAVRSGLGLEEFYRKAGWAEVGRWPGALRVAHGDDRDEILMSLAL
ncbi:GNAT family N-acetyltransferase [Streptomyces sp. ISL-112]|nr:GNAT family N-acetyltransferase [Streptomyces sp. ISL-112]MBT2464308.1 GNAT family N-acetyltransferase [Streptomyces sp. ISL-63]